MNVLTVTRTRGFEWETCNNVCMRVCFSTVNKKSGQCNKLDISSLKGIWETYTYINQLPLPMTIAYCRWSMTTVQSTHNKSGSLKLALMSLLKYCFCPRQVKLTGAGEISHPMISLCL